MLVFLLASTLALGAFDHDHAAGETHSHAETEATSEATSTVAADVRTIDAEARTAMVRHEPLVELGMPAMVMQFAIANDVDLALFEPGAALIITARRSPDGLEIIAAEPEIED